MFAGDFYYFRDRVSSGAAWLWSHQPLPQPPRYGYRYILPSPDLNGYFSFNWFSFACCDRDIVQGSLETEKHSTTQPYPALIGHFLNMCEYISIFAYVFSLLYFELHDIFKCSLSFELNLLKYNYPNRFNVIQFIYHTIHSLKCVIQNIEYFDISEQPLL